MSTLTIKLDDDAAGLVAKSGASGGPVRGGEEWLRECICQAAAQSLNHTQTARERVAPLHPVAMQTTSDFNAPLEEFSPYV